MVYDVVDGFESSKEHFDKIFGVEEEAKAKKQTISKAKKIAEKVHLKDFSSRCTKFQILKKV